MAVKKKTPASKALATKVHAMVSMDDLPEEMRSAFAVGQNDRDREKLESRSISIKSNLFTLNKQLIGAKGSSFVGVILESAFLNALYQEKLDGKKYDPDNSQPPICFSVSVDAENGLKPHANSSKPQAGNCEECPQNKWGSDPEGKGKMCGNRRRMAVILIEEGQDLSADNVVVLTLPPTSIGNWKKYYQGLLAIHNTKPCGAITRVYFDAENPKGSALPIAFEFIDKLRTIDQYRLVSSLMASAREMVGQVWPKAETGAVASAKAGSGQRAARVKAKAKAKK